MALALPSFLLGVSLLPGVAEASQATSLEEVGVENFGLAPHPFSNLASDVLQPN